MDEGIQNQEQSGPADTDGQMDDNNNSSTQGDETRLQESKDGTKEHSPGESTQTKDKSEGVEGEDKGEASGADEVQPAQELHEGEASGGGDDVPPRDSEPKNEVTEEEGKKDSRDGEVTDGDKTEKTQKKEKREGEKKAKAGEDKESVTGAEKTKQTEATDGDAKDKGKVKEAEKQGKTKRKAAPPSSVPRPRTSARSVRASAKKDIIAKFQQGAPETPLPRNFKIQKSATAAAAGASIKQKILDWCRNKTRKYEGISIDNFSSSWSDGMAFCALIHRFFPEAFDYATLSPKEREKNFTLAFQTAESLADCYPLLEVKDMLMMGNNPDPMCVFTYVQSLCQSFTKIEKQRKDKEQEEKDKATAEGKGKGEEGVKEEKEEEREEGEEGTDGLQGVQEEKEGEGAEKEGDGEEETKTKEGELVEAET